MTETPANTARPIGNTLSLVPGSWNGAAVELDAAAVPEALGELDVPALSPTADSEGATADPEGATADPEGAVPLAVAVAARLVEPVDKMDAPTPPVPVAAAVVLAAAEVDAAADEIAVLAIVPVLTRVIPTPPLPPLLPLAPVTEVLLESLAEVVLLESLADVMLVDELLVLALESDVDVDVEELDIESVLELDVESVLELEDPEPLLLPFTVDDTSVTTQTRSSRTRLSPLGPVKGVRVISHVSVTGPCAV